MPDVFVREPNAVLVLAGCTAAGKSDVAIELAERTSAEIICVDSMQVYRGMNIGTAKPDAAMCRRVPHHLLDVVPASEPFTAALFSELADAAINDIRARGRVPMLVAGTPFYLMSVLYGMFEGPSADDAFRTALRERAAAVGNAAIHDELVKVDPEAASRIHRNDLKRVERALEVHHITGQPISALRGQWDAPPRYPVIALGLQRDRELLARRINMRVHQMVDAGLVEEVQSLIHAPGGLSIPAAQALGYAEIIAALKDEMPLEKAIEQIKVNTRRFAKSQRTWFRKIPGIRWLEIPEFESPVETATRAAEWIATADSVSLPYGFGEV